MNAERARAAAGFSLLELLIAAALLTGSAALLFHFALKGHRLSRSQPDAADLHQRLRVAVDMMRRDLLMAGAGTLHGPRSGPLVNYLPPLVPARTGAIAPDPEGSAFPDRLSVFYVPDGGWHVPLAAPVVDPAADVVVDAGFSGCPASGVCGFVVGTRALILDPSGPGAGYDAFTVTGATGGLAHGSPNPPFSAAYDVTARVMPLVQRVYYFDRPSRRLMVYDGYQTDLPLVDNVADLRFEYFADPAPENAPAPSAGQDACTFAAGPPPAPLLAVLPGPTASPLAPGDLTDGPFCGVAPHRFDGDLLRLRRVRVTVRLQVGGRELRGAGAAFDSPGISTSGDSYVPDYQLTFEVAARNMYPTR